MHSGTLWHHPVTEVKILHRSIRLIPGQTCNPHTQLVSWLTKYLFFSFLHVQPMFVWYFVRRYFAVHIVPHDLTNARFQASMIHLSVSYFSCVSYLSIDKYLAYRRIAISGTYMIQWHSGAFNQVYSFQNEISWSPTYSRKTSFFFILQTITLLIYHHTHNPAYTSFSSSNFRFSRFSLLSVSLSRAFLSLFVSHGSWCQM